MSASLESYVNRPVSVITADGRNFVGTLKVGKTENTKTMLGFVNIFTVGL